MKNLKLSFLIPIGMLIFSCAGVKFANSPVNKELPETFTKRAIYPAGVAGYDFQDLVGNILLIKKSQDPIRIGLIRPNEYINEVIPITDPNNYYKSRIQKGAELKGNYMAFAANFSADQLAELELVDIARSGIAFENDNIFQQIIEKSYSWVSQHPNNDTSVRRLWIKSVVLSRRIYNEFTNVGSKASGQVGDVVGVSTGVYNKTEESIKSVMIAFEAFDIDELVKRSIRPDPLQTLIPESYNKSVEFALYKGIIQGEIKYPAHNN